MSVSVEPKIRRLTAENLAWFRGAGLLTPINHSANPDFVTWRWLNTVRQDDRVNVVMARLWPPPTRDVPEELRFRRRRDRKSKGNTGASAAVASHIRAFESFPADGCRWYPTNCDDHSAGFLVHDPGAFHWRTLNQAARTESPDKAEVAEHDTTLSNFVSQKRYILRRNTLLPEAPSPRNFWAGDDDTPDFIEGTGHVYKRGRDRYKTDEEDFQDREALEATRKKCEAILLAGEAWSPLDPPEDTVVREDGVKYNRSNLKFKQLMWNINVATKNYDTQKELARELGLKYNTVRQGESEDINMNKTMPTTKFGRAQIEEMLEHDGRVVYVHVTLDRGRWYKLDMERHATYREAIEEVRWRAQDEALKKAGVPSRPTDRRTPESDPVLARAFKEVVVRFDEAFKPEHLYIADWRTPTVSAQAQIAWEEENGVPNVTPAP